MSRYLAYLRSIIRMSVDDLWRGVQRTPTVCGQEIGQTVKVGQTKVCNLQKRAMFQILYLENSNHAITLKYYKNLWSRMLILIVNWFSILIKVLRTFFI